MGLLSLAIWLPIIFGAFLLLFGRESQARMVRWLALIGAIISLLVTLPLYDGFQLGTSAMQFVENSSWVPRFNMNYHVGVDGISLWFVLLTAFINVTHDWRVHRAGRHAVLRVLRGHLDPDVSHHRHLGRPQQDLRSLQVFLVHAAGLALDAGCVHLSVQQVRRQL